MKEAKAEIKKLNNELEQRVAQRTRQLMIVNNELREEIEERQRVQAALQQSQVELAHVARLTAMGELVASIAHEVGQPLTAIVTNGSFLLRRLQAGRRMGTICEARQRRSSPMENVPARSFRGYGRY